jgi:hypothetical protein
VHPDRPVSLLAIDPVIVYVDEGRLRQVIGALALRVATDAATAMEATRKVAERLAGVG